MCELKNNVNFTPIYIFDTILHADSVEWCPHVPNQHIFVCANYQLEENETNKRIGRINLLSISPSEIRLHQTIDIAGVLDQKWCHNEINGCSILGVVTADDSVEIYRLTADIRLELVTSMRNQGTDILKLSLDWNTGKYASSEPKIVTSDSDGRIATYTLSNALIADKSWKSHDFQAWICAYDYWDCNVIFTGGDDCKLLKHDVRCEKPVFVSRKHSAGVTALHSNKQHEHILASGSYDSYVYVWDTRFMKTELCSLEMPGTVWRLKWNPHDYKHLLAACMRDGFHVVKFEDDKLDVVANYFEHEDLAYGCDWCYLTDMDGYEGEGNTIVGACSFYDHKLSVAKVNLLIS